MSNSNDHQFTLSNADDLINVVLSPLLAMGYSDSPQDHSMSKSQGQAEDEDYYNVDVAPVLTNTPNAFQDALDAYLKAQQNPLDGNEIRKEKVKIDQFPTFSKFDLDEVLDYLIGKCGCTVLDSSEDKSEYLDSIDLMLGRVITNGDKNKEPEYSGLRLAFVVDGPGNP